jgi:hypothetical protein
MGLKMLKLLRWLAKKRPSQIDSPAGCALPDCTNPRKKDRPFCGLHWSQVPRVLQLRILAALKSLDTNGLDLAVKQAEKSITRRETKSGS